MLSKLRAALTPQIILLLAAVVAGVMLMQGESAFEQQTALEIRTQQVLSKVDGAGNVSVVISVKKTHSPSATALSGGYAAQEVPCGAIVVAQGADDPWVNTQLTQAICALLGLPASSVSVMQGGG